MCSVDRRDGQECGRKMWTCWRDWDTRFFKAAFRVGEMGVWAVGMCEIRWWRVISARRGMLMWWRGSKIITAADWPARVMEENVGGKMAWAMMR